MALKMPKLFGESKAKLATAEAELEVPTTHVRMGGAAPEGYDPLASVSVMEQLRSATAKVATPWKLPGIGGMPVAKQLQVLGTAFFTLVVMAVVMIGLDNRAASHCSRLRRNESPCPRRRQSSTAAFCTRRRYVARRRLAAQRGADRSHARRPRAG